MRTLFQTIKQQFLEGNDLVLVSVTASSGSTPRGAGSRMLVGKNGRISGTIGGGAVEYRAECMALDILEKKESCEHEFRLNHKDVENIGMICGGDVTAFFQYLDHNDPIIMEITETAEKFYEERKDFWLICDLLTTSGASTVLHAVSSELPMFLLLYYLLCLQSHTDITVKIMICFLNRLEPQELSMYSAADMSHKSLSQSLQALIFAVLSWMTGRNLQILLFSQEQLKQYFVISTIWTSMFLLQLLIIAAS